MNTATITEKTAMVETSAVELGQGTLKATALASFVPIEAHLTTLAARYDKVAFSDLATPKGLAAAKAIRLELREQGRFAVQRLQKRLKDEANDLKRIVDDRSEELIAIIRPVEDNAHAQIEAEEVRRAEAKAEKERLEFEERARLAAIEAERIAGLQAGIAKIRGYVARCQEPGMTSERIAAGIAHLEAQVLGAEWGDHLEQARAAQAESLAAMRSLYASALVREDDAARLEAQRIENERVAAELAEMRAVLAAQQAELDRQAAEHARLEAESRAAFVAEYAAVEQAKEDAEQRAEAKPYQEDPQADEDERRNAEPMARVVSVEIVRDDSDPTGKTFRAGAMTHSTELATDPGADGVFELPEFDGAAGTVEDIPAGEVTEAPVLVRIFADDRPEAPALGHPEAAAAIHTLEVEVDTLVERLGMCQAALIQATNMLDKLIVAHSPKRMAAGYFARVATLRDMGGLPRPTTTTTKENN